MPFKSITIVLSTILLIGHLSYAQDTKNQKHLEVALRMIGHQVLLSANDSTSRVLPITKTNDTYKIAFNTEFAFEPEILVNTIDSIVKQTKIAESYVVEMKPCQSAETIYSYKVDSIHKADIIPCQGRLQPKACYDLFFTIVSPHVDALLTPNNSNGATRSSPLINYILGTLLLCALGLWLYVFLNKRREQTNPDLIALGEYYFDKRNTELILENQRIELTSKEADLLLLLYNSANTTVEREVILNKIWEDEGHYIGRTLDVFISKLRKKLEFDTKVKIVNIRGVGYKLVIN